ncbi:MAG: methyltransferase domain-containing protein, partial [Gemmatimonadales bacterium]
MVNAIEATYARVRQRYEEVAASGTCCAPACCGAAYAPAELAVIPPESFLGQGSGHPVRHAQLQPGEVVVDLGSGAGADVFLAAKQVGPTGRVIGIDITPAMVARARRIQVASGVTNVAFQEARMEQLPLADHSADVVLSNCVINLSPAKEAVFREALRILRPGGRVVMADIVQERLLGLLEEDCGCVATAMVRAEYLN